MYKHCFEILKIYHESNNLGANFFNILNYFIMPQMCFLEVNLILLVLIY